MLPYIFVLIYKVQILRLLSMECIYHSMVLLHWTEGVFILVVVLSDNKCTYFGVLLLDTEYIALVLLQVYIVHIILVYRV